MQRVGGCRSCGQAAAVADTAAAAAAAADGAAFEAGPLGCRELQQLRLLAGGGSERRAAVAAGGGVARGLLWSCCQLRALKQRRATAPAEPAAARGAGGALSTRKSCKTVGSAGGGRWATHRACACRLLLARGRGGNVRFHSGPGPAERRHLGEKLSLRKFCMGLFAPHTRPASQCSNPWRLQDPDEALVKRRWRFSARLTRAASCRCSTQLEANRCLYGAPRVSIWGSEGEGRRGRPCRGGGPASQACRSPV